MEKLTEFDLIKNALDRDSKILKEESKKHGECIRFTKYQTKDVWLFSDGYQKEVKK